MTDIIGKQVSGAEVVGMPPGALDGDITLEMTFHADRISAGRRQLCWVDYGSATDVGGAWPMTTLACNAAIRKDRFWVSVFRAAQRPLHPAHMALQATWLGGKV